MKSALLRSPHHHLLRCTAALAVACFTSIAGAQTYPAKPVRLIMPVAPGGPTDTAGRVMSQKLSTVLGQTIVIDNRPGAGGTIATEYAARAAPDGYTLLLASAGTFVTASILYKQLTYDIVKDFAPVTQISVQPLVMVVNPSLPASTVQEFVALAKAEPGKLNYGSAGNATSGHLAGVLFNRVAGIVTVHVPYKGAAAALTGVLQGEVQYQFSSALTSKPHLETRKLKALAVAGDRRSTALPDVLTFEEAGFRGFTAQTWAGVVVPAGTAASIVSRLNSAIREAMASKEVQDTFARFDTRVVSSTPAEFAAVIASERKTWAATLAKLNISLP
jgi:tripartite-type tricarboxylate transporter receptor subunit TctC